MTQNNKPVVGRAKTKKEEPYWLKLKRKSSEKVNRGKSKNELEHKVKHTERGKEEVRYVRIRMETKEETRLYQTTYREKEIHHIDLKINNKKVYEYWKKKENIFESKAKEQVKKIGVDEHGNPIFIDEKGNKFIHIVN